MKPEMNYDREITRSLDDYADALRAERPSAALDSRIEDAIVGWAEEHRSHSVLRKPLLWIAAAASIIVITGGIALLALGQRDGDDPGLKGFASTESELPDLQVGSAVSPLTAGGPGDGGRAVVCPWLRYADAGQRNGC